MSDLPVGLIKRSHRANLNGTFSMRREFSGGAADQVRSANRELRKPEPLTHRRNSGSARAARARGGLLRGFCRLAGSHRELDRAIWICSAADRALALPT